MTFSISRAYMKQKADGEAGSAGAVLSSLLAFFILAGAYLPEFGVDSMGPKSMFLAIITGVGASSLFYTLQRRLRHRALFSTGIDREFNRMLSTLAPIAIVALIFALLNALVVRLFRVDSFHSLLISAFNRRRRAASLVPWRRRSGPGPWTTGRSSCAASGRRSSSPST